MLLCFIFILFFAVLKKTLWIKSFKKNELKTLFIWQIWMIENRPLKFGWQVYFREYSLYVLDLCKTFCHFLVCKTKTWLRNLKIHTITRYLLEQLISSFLLIVCESPSTYLINSFKRIIWIIFSSSHLLLIWIFIARFVLDWYILS